MLQLHLGYPDILHQKHAQPNADESKMVRNAIGENTKKRYTFKREKNEMHDTVITIRSDFTRKRGKDIDQRSNTGSTDDSQLQIVVVGLFHFIIKQLCTAIKDLQLADKNETKISISFQLSWL